jgi:hypothetical protein
MTHGEDKVEALDEIEPEEDKVEALDEIEPEEEVVEKVEEPEEEVVEKVEEPEEEPEPDPDEWAVILEEIEEDLGNVSQVDSNSYSYCTDGNYKGEGDCDVFGNNPTPCLSDDDCNGDNSCWKSNSCCPIESDDCSAGSMPDNCKDSFEPSATKYIVKNGDSCNKIATDQNGMVMTPNNTPCPDTLQPDQLLCIVPTPPPPPTPAPSQTPCINMTDSSDHVAYINKDVETDQGETCNTVWNKLDMCGEPGTNFDYNLRNIQVSPDNDDYRAGKSRMVMTQHAQGGENRSNAPKIGLGCSEDKLWGSSKLGQGDFFACCPVGYWVPAQELMPCDGTAEQCQQEIGDKSVLGDCTKVDNFKIRDMNVGYGINTSWMVNATERELRKSDENKFTSGWSNKNSDRAFPLCDTPEPPEDGLVTSDNLDWNTVDNACVGYGGVPNDKPNNPDSRYYQNQKDFIRNMWTAIDGNSTYKEHWKYCPTITAVMGHESLYYNEARAWDFCRRGSGAVGIFQYDTRSNMKTLPLSIEAQWNTFLSCPSIGAVEGNYHAPCIENFGAMWQACRPHGDGGTGYCESDWDRAKDNCEFVEKEMTGSVTTEWGDKNRWGSGNFDLDDESIPKTCLPRGSCKTPTRPAAHAQSPPTPARGNNCSPDADGNCDGDVCEACCSGFIQNLGLCDDCVTKECKD